MSFYLKVFVEVMFETARGVDTGEMTIYPTTIGGHSKMNFMGYMIHSIQVEGVGEGEVMENTNMVEE